MRRIMRRSKMYTARSAASFIILLVAVNLFVSFYIIQREQVLLHEELPSDNTIPRIQQYAYSSPIIQKLGCAITVILMEPNLNTAVFASLESVAAFVYPRERTCILIQTSICQFQTESTVTSDVAYQYLIETINENAGPLLKEMIKLGNIRVSVLDHVQYQLERCDYFYSPSNPWLNYFYWNDYSIEQIDGTDVRQGEFVHGQDSDFVLTIQKDAVLCTGLDTLAWKEFSFVGAPWPPLPDWWSCSQLRANWITWHSTEQLKDLGISPPSYPSETDFCTDPDIGPIGNGGLSLRSRFWMKQAIDYCPHQVLSGLDNVSTTRTCFLTDYGNEDIYFATILRGFIHHHALNSSLPALSIRKSPPSPLKLPSMMEAAFFATETQWLRDLVTHYEIPSGDLDVMVQKLAWWGGKYDQKKRSSELKATVEDGRERFQRLKLVEEQSLGKKPFIPIGLHKVWKYAESSLLGEIESFDHFIKECPYLKDIIPKDYYHN